jgi:hypothetical protein
MTEIADTDFVDRVEILLNSFFFRNAALYALASGLEIHPEKGFPEVQRICHHFIAQIGTDSRFLESLAQYVASGQTDDRRLSAAAYEELARELPASVAFVQNLKGAPLPIIGAVSRTPPPPPPTNPFDSADTF